MGYVIGETEGLSTWAKCRRLVGQSYYDDEAGEYVNRQFPDVREMHSVVFYSHNVAPWFRTEKGNGLVRGNFVEGIPPSPFLAFYPTFTWSLYYFEAGEGHRDFFAAGMTPDVRSELQGELVLIDSNAFQIEAEAFSNSGQQRPGVPYGPDNGPVYEVGKLTAV